MKDVGAREESMLGIHLPHISKYEYIRARRFSQPRWWEHRLRIWHAKKVDWLCVMQLHCWYRFRRPWLTSHWYVHRGYISTLHSHQTVSGAYFLHDEFSFSYSNVTAGPHFFVNWTRRCDCLINQTDVYEFVFESELDHIMGRQGSANGIIFVSRLHLERYIFFWWKNRYTKVGERSIGPISSSEWDFLATCQKKNKRRYGTNRIRNSRTQFDNSN